MAVKLSEVLPVPEKVNTGHGHLEVNGLSLVHVVTLINNHRDQFTRLLVIRDGRPDYPYLVSMAPDLVVDIIAMASGNDTDEDKALIRNRLPLAVQLIALETIWRMTVPDVGKLKALLSEVMAMLGVKSWNELKSAPNTIAESMEPSKPD